MVESDDKYYSQLSQLLTGDWRDPLQETNNDAMTNCNSLWFNKIFYTEGSDTWQPD